MAKEFYCSSNSQKALEEQIRITSGDVNAYIDGKNVKCVIEGLSVKQNGNNWVCYIKAEKNCVEAMREEMNLLYVSKENPKRLQELIKKIDYFDYGIK